MSSKEDNVKNRYKKFIHKNMTVEEGIKKFHE